MADNQKQAETECELTLEKRKWHWVSFLLRQLFACMEGLVSITQCWVKVK